MKTENPMPTLQKLFMEPGVKVSPPMKTLGKPRVEITKVRGKTRVTFQLRKIIKGQTFLGIYPAAATLPDADGLKAGDYALLTSGEVLQIL
jgi:hypothetical protein